MNKLALRLEDLTVDSFETQTPRGTRGTVRGHDSAYISMDLGCQGTFNPQNTCASGCQPGESVGMTCECASQGCTNDPGDMFCYDSYNFCIETVNAGTCRNCTLENCGATTEC